MDNLQTETQEIIVAQPPPARRGWRRPIDYWLLWVAVFALIAVNVYLVNTLLQIERDIDSTITEIKTDMAAGALEVAAGIDELRNASIVYDVVIDESIPINMSVLIDMEVPVDIQEEIAVSTTVFTRLPPLNIPYNFPISTTIPVDIQTSIPIQEQVDINDTIPVQFDVPIVINVSETPFAQSLDDAYYGLLEFAHDLGADIERPVRPNAP